MTTDVVLLEKRCGRCERTLPASEFYVNRTNKTDGLHYACKDCARSAALDRIRREKAQDPEGYRKRQREIVARSRATNPAVLQRARLLQAAEREAVKALKALHQSDWEQLYRIEKHARGLL